MKLTEEERKQRHREAVKKHDSTEKGRYKKQLRKKRWIFKNKVWKNEYQKIWNHSTFKGQLAKDLRKAIGNENAFALWKLRYCERIAKLAARKRRQWAIASRITQTGENTDFRGVVMAVESVPLFERVM